MRSPNLVVASDGLKSAGVAGGGMVVAGGKVLQHAGQTWLSNSSNSINGLRKCLSSTT